MMNNFIVQYIEKLKHISSEKDIIALYHWFWDNQNQIEKTANQVNDEYSLSGEYILQPDLPCLTIGSTKGLLFLAVNPGWRKDMNEIEDSFCRQSKENYINLMLGFFEHHPNVIGKRIRWWSNALSWVKLLKDYQNRFGELSGAEKWEKAYSSKLVGGWELFPFHSSKDGISQYIHEAKWLKDCAVESLRAALRLQPEVLFVASKRSWELVRVECFPDANWNDSFVVSGESKIKVSYARYSEKTEIIAIAMQILSAHRKFTNEQLIDEIENLRKIE